MNKILELNQQEVSTVSGGIVTEIVGGTAFVTAAIAALVGAFWVETKIHSAINSWRSSSNSPAASNPPAAPAAAKVTSNSRRGRERSRIPSRT